jgi:hypothetical protein
MSTDIKLKIIVDGKEATATINATDENIKELYKSFKYGQADVNGLTTSISRGMTNARDIIQGVKETFSVLRNMFAQPLQMAIADEVLRSNFSGAEQDLQNFRKAVAGTISDAGLIKLSNQATDLGLSLQQQTLFFALAEDAADKYGGGVESNFNKLVAASEGAGKGLKSLGIQKEQYNAVLEDLAKQQGKTIANLDAETQKQLRLEAVIIASGISMDDVNKKTADNADKMEQLTVGTERLQVAVGKTTATAFVPMVDIMNNLLTALNYLPTGISGTIGAIGSLGAAFTVLRVTGIIPAISQIQLFGVSLLSIKGIMVGLASSAAIGGLIVGLDLLAGAYNRAKSAQDGFKNAGKGWISQMKTEMEGMNKTQLEYEVKLSASEKTLLEARKKTLSTQIEASKQLKAIVDKEGNSYEYKVDTKRTEQLKDQLFILDQQIEKEKERGVYAEVLLQKEAKKKPSSTDEEIKKEFANNKALLEEKQRHETVMSDIQGKSDIERYNMKLKHLNDMLALHRRYGQSTVRLSNEIAEEQAKTAVTGSIDPASVPMKLGGPGIKEQADKGAFKPEAMQQMGGDDMARLQANSIDDATDRELAITRVEYDANISRYKNYENYTAIKHELDIQYANSVNNIEARKSEAIVSNARSALGTVAGMFGKHTLAYKLMAVTNGTIDAIQTGISVYKSIAAIPITGPFLAPIMAIAAGGAQMASVAKIVSTPTPKMPGYERGGVVVGENGPEVITPMQDYTQGQALMLRGVIAELRGGNVFGSNNNNSVAGAVNGIMDRLDKWQRELQFKISGDDIYTINSDAALRVKARQL